MSCDAFNIDIPGVICKFSKLKTKVTEGLSGHLFKSATSKCFHCFLHQKIKTTFQKIQLQIIHIYIIFPVSQIHYLTEIKIKMVEIKSNHKFGFSNLSKTPDGSCTN